MTEMPQSLFWNSDLSVLSSLDTDTTSMAEEVTKGIHKQHVKEIFLQQQFKNLRWFLIEFYQSLE